MPSRLRFFLLSVTPLLASLALIAIAVRQQQHDLHARERALVESAYMAAKKTELRNYVELAQSAIAPLYDTHLDDAETLKAAQRVLEALDYGIDGYFFVFDATGRNVMHPRQPELVGRDLFELRDVDGTPVIQQLIASAHAGGDYVQYVWQKPSTYTQTPKLGYAVSLPRWNWVVGTGLYLDDIQATLAQLDRQVSDNVAATLGWIAGIAAFGVVLIGLTGFYLNVSDARVADAKLRLLARQVVKSQEDERAHLSRELHDSTSQTLVSIKLLLESTTAQLARTGTVAPAPLTKALCRLSDALHEVRTISHRLRPAELDVLGLPVALEQMGDEFSSHADMAFSLRVRGEPARLPDEVNTVLFRVAQEGLTNIEKHAGATRVQLRLLFHAGGLRMRLMDDGGGFDVPAVRADPRRGIGLRNMRERVESIGGAISMTSRPGSTQLLVDIPQRSIDRFRAQREAA
ncbi:cache domain-containing protein [Piscinibacter sp. XHJ-5]|uniref:cache domain-containing protein n=1 Tax=Piscinibacter sp. XHJ-5 TaxID=3037797 RepID=UPI002452F5C6|nr:cache domain-containing protein [Piscinibacter sp. XHJ-5]